MIMGEITHEGKDGMQKMKDNKERGLRTGTLDEK